MAGGVWRAAILISVPAVLLAACASGADSEPTEDDEFTLPRAPAPSASPGKSFGAAQRTISGVLGFEGIEGGCFFVEAADRTRYEVVYPDGWTLDRLAGELRADDGRVAQVGDSLTVRGIVATDRSSICQIGPIFVASQVDIESR